jgi:hypothetical protein
MGDQIALLQGLSQLPGVTIRSAVDGYKGNFPPERVKCDSKFWTLLPVDQVMIYMFTRSYEPRPKSACQSEGRMLAF